MIIVIILIIVVVVVVVDVGSGAYDNYSDIYHSSRDMLIITYSVFIQTWRKFPAPCSLWTDKTMAEEVNTATALNVVFIILIFISYYMRYYKDARTEILISIIFFLI